MPNESTGYQVVMSSLIHDLTMELCPKCHQIYGTRVMGAHREKFHSGEQNGGSLEKSQTPAIANNVDIEATG